MGWELALTVRSPIHGRVFRELNIFIRSYCSGYDLFASSKSRDGNCRWLMRAAIVTRGWWVKIKRVANLLGRRVRELLEKEAVDRLDSQEDVKMLIAARGRWGQTCVAGN
jgi:hypothetical protein